MVQNLDGTQAVSRGTHLEALNHKRDSQDERLVPHKMAGAGQSGGVELLRRIVQLEDTQGTRAAYRQRGKSAPRHHETRTG